MTVETGPPIAVLIIPITGLLEMIESDKRIDAEATLVTHGNRGGYVSAALQRDRDPAGVIHFHTLGTRNPRAEDAVHQLTGIRIEIPTCAVLTNLTAGMLREIVYELSRRDY